MKNRRVFRQGDVAFFEVEELPYGAKITSNELVIHGETPDHLHRMPNVQVATALKARRLLTFVVVPEGGAEMTHPDHPVDLVVPVGVYEVRQAREYPEETLVD